MVTDWKDNLPELFNPDKEMVTYRTADECLEKVSWLLQHPRERAEIAKAGQARTLRDHTYARRAIQLDRIIRSKLKMKKNSIYRTY
jgi:spore maturation protein CgeB